MRSSSHFRIIKKQLPISGCTFSLADIRRMYDVLDAKVREASELEVINWVRPDNEPQEKFEANKNTIKNLFTLTVLIRGTDGSDLQGTNVEVFDSRNMPEEIASIYFDSATDARIKNYQPAN